MNTRPTMPVTALTIGIASCGGGSSRQATTSADPSPGAPATPAASSPAQAAAPKARDVSALRACEIVTPQDVARVTGGKLLNEPPGGFSNCTYVLEVKGATESYRLAFSEPALYTSMLAAQTGSEKGDRQAGLWDEAYLQPRAVGGGYSLIAVRRDDVADTYALLSARWEAPFGRGGSGRGRPARGVLKSWAELGRWQKHSRV